MPCYGNMEVLNQFRHKYAESSKCHALFIDLSINRYSLIKGRFPARTLYNIHRYSFLYLRSHESVSQKLAVLAS